MRDFNLAEMNDNAHMFGNPYKHVQDIRRVTIGVRMGRMRTEVLVVTATNYLVSGLLAEGELNRRSFL
jgi:hypothetical protein